MLTCQLTSQEEHRPTDVAESLPLALPLGGGTLEHLDKLPKVLLVCADCVADPLQLGVDLLEILALAKSGIGSVRIELQTIALVSVLRLEISSECLGQPLLTLST